jgi:hypothetical protein
MRVGTEQKEKELNEIRVNRTIGWCTDSNNKERTQHSTSLTTKKIMKIGRKEPSPKKRDTP